MNLITSHLVSLRPQLKCILVLLGLILSLYCLLIHFSLTEWLQLKHAHQQLKQRVNELSHKQDSANPLQHDPLIHSLIKYAQEHELEITNTKFNKMQNQVEEFSCELLGTYPNTLNFIKSLFASTYLISLKGLAMSNEIKAHYLKTQLIFKHHV